MPPTDTNARIAVDVMGWRLCPRCWGSPIRRCFCTNDVTKHRDEIPDFARSLDACTVAEEEIDRRGLRGEYMHHVEAGFEAKTGTPEIRDEYGWMEFALWCIRLTPTQRCEALLAAVGAKP